MKIKVIISACSALLLSGCMSTSGTYRQNVVYEGDGYYDSADVYPSDDGYYDNDYYDSGYYDGGYYDSGYYGGGYYGGGFYGGISYGSGYGDPFWYGGYGYCSPRYAFCPGSPLFYGGGYGYGYGYGYGWPYWGFRDDDRDHHHHHHHRDNPPDPVVVNPPPVNLPGINGEPGRVFLTPHPRKGVFRPNDTRQPQPMVDAGDNDGDRTPRARPNDGSGNVPPMRWRPPATRPAPTDQLTQDGTQSGSIQDRRPQLASDRPPPRSVEPPPPNRAVDRVQISLPSRSDSTPEPRTSDSSSSSNDNDRPQREHRRGNDAGGGH